MDVWRIEREGYEPENATDNGNRFLIGNGNIGVRGTLEEYTANKLVAVNLAGIYDRAPGQTWREPINAPNPFFVQLEGQGAIIKHTQSLDIRHGLHHRETVYENAILTIERFCSMAEASILCQRISVQAKGKPITIITGIDSNVWDINGTHLVDYETELIDEVIKVSAITSELRIPITVSERCNHKENKIREIDNSVFRIFTTKENIVLDRIISINSELTSGTYDEKLKAHIEKWELLWSASEVKITGDKKAQLSLNYSIYHLHSIAPRHKDGLSIPARGLSGQTYKGAIFWDTEIFLMPFFTLTEPKMARRLMKYRINTLQGALDKAAYYGYQGAFYPWESQDGGLEGCTDFNVVDVFTNRPVRTHFRDLQIHISGDIVYALKKYIDWTNDDSILSDGGNKLIKASADFYLSRAFSRPGSDVLEFIDVIGPDEYHERVYNSAFTNRIAEYSLRQAGYDNKVRGYREIDGIIEQFDGYFDLEDVSLDTVRSRLVHPKEYWGTQGGVASTTQIIKQADVLALMQLFGDEFSDDKIKKNWEYYEPRTEHGSSLSACMYALGACRFGRADLAYPLFMKSARSDLDGGGKSWAGNIYIGGTHPAAAGGAYMIATQGFAGLHLKNGKPMLKPSLPEQFDSIEFPFIFANKNKTVSVTHKKAEIC
ncbi:MAG: glycoside hydrolase family 65 protein [Oscillospiraceae bacterium]|jgi:kojibiose phosphorylase/nigerose phosphorylase|nr:glycoside hydrolase family 65 protein [Oscillospiraceae bacterium]